MFSSFQNLMLFRCLNFISGYFNRAPIIIDEVATPNFNSFTSAITLHIPNSKVVTLLGEERTDKNAAKDSAALAMLLKLQQLGICVLEKP